jgi:hypothetical protein
MVVAATGQAPMDALADLVSQASAEARRIADGFREGEHATRPDAVWSFEVVDVRLVPGVVTGGAQNWAAYGTLVSEGPNPWAGSYWHGR